MEDREDDIQHLEEDASSNKRIKLCLTSGKFSGLKLFSSLKFQELQLFSYHILACICMCVYNLLYHANSPDVLAHEACLTIYLSPCLHFPIPNKQGTLVRECLLIIRLKVQTLPLVIIIYSSASHPLFCFSFS